VVFYAYIVPVSAGVSALAAAGALRRREPHRAVAKGLLIVIALIVGLVILLMAIDTVVLATIPD
jgi:hypothetical protein